MPKRTPEAEGYCGPTGHEGIGYVVPRLEICRKKPGSLGCSAQLCLILSRFLQKKSEKRRSELRWFRPPKSGRRIADTLIG